MTGRLVSAAVVLAFFLLGLVGILNHEMWRDELAVWLIARDSASLAELFVNIGHQEHTALWYLLTYPLTRLTDSPVAMQFLHLLIATAAVGVFLRFAPFRPEQRILFCFGYFLFYEYSVISRSYGLEFLLVFVFCALFPGRTRHHVSMALVLFLLAHTNAYGLVIAASLMLLLGVEALTAGERLRYPRSGRLALSAVVAVSGIVTALIHLLLQVSRTDDAYAPGWDFGWFAGSISTVAYGYIPLPDLGAVDFWDRTALQALPQPVGAWVGILLAVSLITFSSLTLTRKLPTLMLFLVGSASMLSIVFFLHHGQLRHHGQVYMLFVVCCWLEAHVVSRDRPGENRVVSLRPAFLTLLFSIQLAAGILTYSRDLSRPFSNAATAAAYLEQTAFRDTILVGSTDYAVQPIAAYIDREIYYPESRSFGTFVSWDRERVVVAPIEALAAAVELVREDRQDVVLILSGRPPDFELGSVVSVTRDVTMEYVASFEGAIVTDENYYLGYLSPAQ